MTDLELGSVTEVMETSVNVYKHKSILTIWYFFKKWLTFPGFCTASGGGTGVSMKVVKSLSRPAWAITVKVTPEPAVTLLEKLIWMLISVKESLSRYTVFGDRVYSKKSSVLLPETTVFTSSVN